MITAIFAAVNERLRQNLEAVGDALPSHSLGSASLDETSSPPNIVWELIGGHVAPSKQSSADGRREIRQIAMRSERVLVHVWGDSFEAAEILANHFVAAAREVCTSGFAFRPISTDWTAGQAMKTARGRCLIVTVEFDIPFTSEPLAISKPPHHLTLNTEIIHPA